MGRRSDSAYDFTLVTADDVRLPMMVAPENVGSASNPRMVKRWAGAANPALAAERFTRQNVRREWKRFDGGMGVSYASPELSNMYDYGIGIYTLHGGAMPAGLVTTIAMPTPASGALGQVVASTEFGGDLYLVAGRFVLRMVQGWQDPTIVQDLVSLTGVATYLGASAVTHNGALYIGGYSSGGASKLVKYDGTTWTASADANRWLLKGAFQVDADGRGAYRLFGTCAGNSSFKYVTGTDDPMVDANWTPSTALQVGSTSYSISSLEASGQRVWFVKQEGTYEATRAGTYIVNYTPYMSDALWQYNGVATKLINGKLFVNGLAGIDQITGLDGRRNDAPGLIQPGRGLPFVGPIGGPSYAMTSQSGWLVMALHNATNDTSYVMRYRGADEVQGLPGTPAYGWHGAEATFTNERVSHLVPGSPFGNPRLTIATVRTTGGQAGQPKLYWESCPRDGNPEQDLLLGAPHRFATSAQLYVPHDDWGLGTGSRKTPRRIASVNRYLSSSSFVEAYLKADEDDYEKVGATITQSYQSARITSPQSGRRLGLRFDFTGTTTAPPVFDATEVAAGVSFEPYQAYQIRCLFGEGLPLHGGGWSTDEPSILWRQIFALGGRTPVDLYDPFGDRYSVQIEQDQSWLVEDRFSDAPESHVREAVITFTVLRSYNTWGSGLPWSVDEW